MNPDPHADPARCERCGSPLETEGPAGFCRVCIASDLASEDTDGIFEAPQYSGSLTSAGFTLREVIGTGGMGQVFRAIQASPPREVAVKMLLPHLGASTESRRRFLAEAEAMAQMDHPGIVPLYAAGESDGKPWMAMKLVRGGTLAEHRSRYSGRWREIAQLTAAIADAVQHAHTRGIIHRDLKPANILFDEAGSPCVSDFGLAKWRDPTAQHTYSRAMLGTLAYLPPESVSRGAAAVTTASDIYGLGTILYELLTGRPPYTGEADFELLNRIVTEDPPPPRQVVPQVPQDLEVVCLKALARSPGNRYASADAFAADLRAWLRGDPVVARPVTITARMVRLARRHPVTSALSALCVMLALGGGIYIWWQNQALKDSLRRVQKARDNQAAIISYMSEDLPGRLEAVGRSSVLESVFSQNDAFFQEAVQQAAGSEDESLTLARYADFLSQWSRVLRHIGRSPEALAKLDLAAGNAARAASMPDAGPAAWAALASAHRMKAELLNNLARHAEAWPALSAADNAAAAGLAKFSGDYPLRCALAELANERGDAFLMAGDAESAGSHFERAAAQWKELAAAPPAGIPPMLLRRVRLMNARSPYYLARAAEEQRRKAEAIRLYEAYLSASEELAAGAPDDAFSLRDIVTACGRLSLLSDAGAADGSEEMLQRAEKLVASLTTRDPANLDWKTSAAIFKFHRARRAFHSRDYETAGRLCRETLAALPPEPTMQFQALPCRMEAWADLARCETKLKRWAEVPACHEAAMRDAFAILTEAPGGISVHQGVQSVINSINDDRVDRMEHDGNGNAPAKLKAAQDLEAWARAVIEKLQSIPAPSPEAARLLGWTEAAAHRRLAGAYYYQGRTAEFDAENLTALKLRLAVLKNPAIPPGLPDDIASAAKRFAASPAAGFDAADLLASLTAGAPAASRRDPLGVWRLDWAHAALACLKALPAPAGAAAQEAALAIFPEPPPRAWTAEELTILKSLRAFP